ncbi:hypothetical protein ACT8ZV_15830 [Nocardioides sp. MAHUQ-72]|uniref:hypothetical protein n=1 Tax=unclassified Nocardioides TaxID=2615069 RepID=UPI003612259F
MDIRRVAVGNGDQRLRFRVGLEDARKKGVTVVARWQMKSEPSWIFEAVTHWHRGKKIFRLFVWANTVDRTVLHCPDKAARWSVGAQSAVILEIPSTCIYGPRTWKNFEIFTLPNGFEEAADWAESRRRLRAG